MNWKKKPAALSIAAEEFGKFLVRRRQVPKEDLGAITAESMEEEKATAAGEEGTDDEENESSKELAKNEGAPSAPNHHGGWNVINSKAGLDLFLQKTGQKTGERRLPVFSTVATSNNLKYKYTSSIAVFVPQLGRSLLVRGQGDLRRESEEKCALAALRQLYQIGIVGEFEEGGRMEIKEVSMTTRAKGYAPPNRDYSKQGIDLYLQKAGLPPLFFDTRRKTNSKGNINFISKASIFVPKIGQNLTGEGKAKTLHDANLKCAQHIARQLYDLEGFRLEEPLSKPAGNGTDCGGWNEENSKEALDKYLQKTGHPPASYITSEQTTSERVNLYFSSAYIFVPERREFEGGEGSGRSAEEAERKCAATLVHKLYRMNVLEEFQESAKESDEKAIIVLESQTETWEIASDHDEFKYSYVDTDPIPGSSVEAQMKTKTGGWNQENSQSALNEYLKKKGLPNAVYRTAKKISKKGHKRHNSSLSLRIPEIRKEVTARGLGTSGPTAEANCAMMMVRQLYRMNVFQKFEKKEEALDGPMKPKTEDYGGWNSRNSRKGLEEYLQKTGQPPAVYESCEKIKKGKMRFVTTVSISLPEHGGYSATCKQLAAKKTRAERKCATELVHKLYRMKILGDFQKEMVEEAQSSLKKKTGTGGWNEGNSKNGLDEFLKEKALPPAEYKTRLPKKAMKKNKKQLCFSTLTLFIPEIEKEVTVETNDLIAEKAEAICAMKMARRLYQMNVLEEFSYKKWDGVVTNGGWHQRNCQQGLEEFLEETEQPPVVYEFVQKKIKKGIVIVCTASVHAAGKSVSGYGEKWTAAKAKRECAEQIVIQLYNMKVLGEFQSQGGIVGNGGWNRDNCQEGLEVFLLETGQPPVSYTCYQKTKKKFVCTASVYAAGKIVRRSGTAETQENAEKQCAKLIVIQLYKMKVMGEPEVKEKAIKTLPPIPVSLPQKLVARVKNYIRLKAATPVVPTPEVASLTDPQSLILFSHRHFARFPISKIARPRMIPWSPPMPNWNPWKGCEIGQEPWTSKTMSQMNQFIEKMEAEKVLNDAIFVKRRNLPVTRYRQQIIDTVAENRVTLIKGATGCGKSTQVSQYLLESFLESGRGAEFNAYVTQPRRISAISLAERVAVERNEEAVGGMVGYGVRFDSVYPRPYGSIFFCTIGFLLKKMEKGLRGVSHVIIDEIHERDINTDLVLIVLREMVKEYPELRIVLMSATVDTTMFSDYFGGCPVIEIEGRSYPVKRLFLEDIVKQLDYMPEELPTEPRKKNKSNGDKKNKNLNILDKDADPKLQEAMSRIDENDVTYELIENILLDIDAKSEEGAVLIFLPGWMEITTLMDQLAAHSTFGVSSKFTVLPLHSQLPGGELRKVFRFYGHGVRKIIVATNIAETGLTIPDVVYVIDSCKVRETHHIAEHNMIRYDTVWASRSNLTQRSGRAGRVRPGVCYQLCSRARFEALDEHHTAEILRSPLISVALTIKSLRLGSVAEFLAKAIEPPPSDAVEGAETELKEMGAFDDNSELTKLGRIIARLPVDAKVGKAIVLATSLGIGSLMCELAAASSLISPFVPSDPKDRRLNTDQRSFAGNRWSDHAALIAVNQFFHHDMDEEEEREFCKQYSLIAPVLRSSADVKEQLMRSLVHRGFPADVMTSVPADVKGSRVKLELLTSILVSAYYPNVGFHRRRRGIRTLDQMGAQISKMSVLTPGKDDNADPTFPSPLIIFSEKIKTDGIMCRELSLVSAVQLLLFGSRKVECVGENLIRLDNTILLKMNVDVAAALVALRPCVEKHLVKTCLDPKSLLEQTKADRKLIAILYELSSSSLFAEAESKKIK